jgi:hypothetical protein
MNSNLFRLPAKFDSNMSSEEWVRAHAARIASFLPVDWTPMSELDPELIVFMKDESVPIDDRSDLAMVMSSLGVLGIVEVRPDLTFRRGREAIVTETRGPLH